MSWHFLRGGVEESWAGNCLDGAPNVLLKLIPTQEKSSSPAKKTEFSNPSQSGMTLEPSTENPGEAQLISLPGASLAKISARQEKERESKQSEAGCGWKWPGSFVKFDHGTHLWRTRQGSLVEGLDLFSGTWPKWGIMRNGECSERTMLVLPTSETEFGSLLPTPTASQNGSSNNGKRGDGSIFKTAGKLSLSAMAARNVWPTPTVKGNYNKKAYGFKSGDGLHVAVQKKGISGPLNPTWVGWLMGYPLGWTDLKPLGMGKFREWLNLHGVF